MLVFFSRRSLNGVETAGIREKRPGNDVGVLYTGHPPEKTLIIYQSSMKWHNNCLTMATAIQTVARPSCLDLLLVEHSHMEMTSMRMLLPVAITAMAGFALAAAPAANANLVQNGGFEETPLTESGVIESGDTTSITDWQNNATFTLLVFPGQGDNTSGGLGGFALWGPANGVANGLPATSPAGGNYIGLDGDVDFRGSGLSQTINGLVAGQSYDLSFYFAAGQEWRAGGATTEAITASLGSQSFTTDTRDTPYQGFSAWELKNFVFTATGTNELLSFLAIGTPSGAPPISLIDGISLTSTTVAAPEPATWALMLVGIAGIGGATWLRRKAAKTAARNATA